MTKINQAQLFDTELQDIVHYCFSAEPFSQTSLLNAHIALMDAMACAYLSLDNKFCKKHLGPLVKNTEIHTGARVPGTQYELDPVQAAYNISTMIRWLDFNDTWLAYEWGHPSDNIGAILACADYYSRQNSFSYTMTEVLTAIIKAYEIQGILALKNSFNELGYDHVILVKIASTALATKLLGGNEIQTLNALSNALIDGVALRVYRQGINTGARKSWAAADASSRGVRHALWAINDEPGYNSVLTAPQWGFNAVVLNNNTLIRNQTYQHYVIDQILYKISYPVEFHAQTAIECAIKLHKTFLEKYQLDITQIESITIYTQLAAMKIINKQTELRNPADRDHCLQYCVAVALITGNLNYQHYQDDFALNNINKTKIDAIRAKTVVIEDKIYTENYYQETIRSISNRILIKFFDGKTSSEEVLFPLGHSRRRSEAAPLLKEKFIQAVTSKVEHKKAQSLIELYSNFDQVSSMSITQWMSMMKNELH